MQTFTEAYKKAADVMAKQKFAAVWPQQRQDKWSSGKFQRPTGFERDRSAVPQKLRDVPTTTARKDGTEPGDVVHAAATNALSARQLADRAAALKFLQQVGRARSSGGQSVWVYAPRKSDAGWVFDAITGDDGTIKQRLNRDDEILSSDERNWMTSALMISRKISEDCKHKLAGGILRNVKASTLEVVERWFNDEDSTDASTQETVRALRAGFCKIDVACSSPTLVFTDYPDWRAQRDDYFGAASRCAGHARWRARRSPALGARTRPKARQAPGGTDRWTVQAQDDPTEELDAQEVFMTEMTVHAAATVLLLKNERRQSVWINQADRSVADVS
jgi:hypothetical protein